jgi:hypothetical protein
MVRYSRTALLLAFAALAIPACGNGGGGDGKSGGGNSGGGSTPQSLFKEDFDGAFPGTAWSAPFATGTGTSIEIDSAGDPALRMTTTDGPSFVGTTTTTSYSSRPVTISVRMSATGTGEGSGGIAILDHLGASVAAAEWHAATPSALTFRIQSTTNPSPVAVPLAGSGFHTFEFSVTSAGEATWSLDGTVVMTRAGFPSDMVKVQLYDNIASSTATTFAVFKFDDLSITTP